MPPDTISQSPESDATSTVFRDTELTLGLPGEGRPPDHAIGWKNTCTKRGFVETVDLNLGSSPAEPRANALTDEDDKSEAVVDGAGKPPAAKTQVVGWPPVRSSRKKALESRKYVKVAAFGAPYLRKVNLKTYSSYQELLRALEQMFTCCTIRGNYLGERNVMDPVKEMEYVPTYEDRDGDWMLVGDVPWKMFIESCRRIRLMKDSEAVGLGCIARD